MYRRVFSSFFFFFFTLQEAGQHERGREGPAMEQEGFSAAEQRGGGPLASRLVVGIAGSELRGQTEIADSLPTQKLQHRGRQTHAGLAQVAPS